MKKFAITAAAALAAVISAPAVFAAGFSISVPNGFTAKVFASGSQGQSKPDDMAKLGSNVFVGYQNGISATGGAAKDGTTQSTIVEYDASGKTIASWKVTGKVDGMGSDSAHHRIVATVNEDGNSSMYLITPGDATAMHLTYTVSPDAKNATGPVAAGGGTDAVTVVNGTVYVSASSPAPDKQGNFTHAALFKALIDTANKTATLEPALMGNATAVDAVNNGPVTLNLSDADSNTLVPSVSPRFAGDVMLDSQGDSELIFIHNIGAKDQSQTRLSLAAQVDDVRWASAQHGTLYVTDNSTNQIVAITGMFTPGTAFASLGKSVDTVDLKTGKLTPFATGFSSSHGMIFVPGTSIAPAPAPSPTPVQGATSPHTGLPLGETLAGALGLIMLGGYSLKLQRRRQ